MISNRKLCRYPPQTKTDIADLFTLLVLAQPRVKRSIMKFMRDNQIHRHHTPVNLSIRL